MVFGKVDWCKYSPSSCLATVQVNIGKEALKVSPFSNPKLKLVKIIIEYAEATGHVVGNQYFLLPPTDGVDNPFNAFKSMTQTSNRIE